MRQAAKNIIKIKYNKMNCDKPFLIVVCKCGYKRTELVYTFLIQGYAIVRHESQTTRLEPTLNSRRRSVPLVGKQNRINSFCWTIPIK